MSTEIELSRPSLAHPAHPGVEVALFSDWRSAVEHLRDHVLTAPECDAWSLILSDHETTILWHDYHNRAAYVLRMMETRGASGQQLFDVYVQAIREAVREANLLSWHASDGSVTVALGTTGLLLLVQAARMRTAFLPGQGHAEAVVWAGGERTGAVLPRERGMRSGGAAKHGRDGEREQRHPEWSPEERIYYRVFRPALQFIRQRYHSSRDLRGQYLRCDYALLKSVLPSCSQLKIAQWRDLRQKCQVPQ